MQVTIEERKRKNGATAILISYRDADGRRRRVVVGKATTDEGLAIVRQEAQRRAVKTELELLEGRYAPRLGQATIDEGLVEFYEHLEGSNRRPTTKRDYKLVIKRFREFLRTTRATRLADVTPDMAVAYIQSRKHLAADTVVGERKRLQAMFQRFINRGLIQHNPWKHPDVNAVTPKAVKHERVFADPELARFLSGCLTLTRSPQAREYHDLFLMLAETGLRLGEALHQRWCDIHLDPDGAYLRVEFWGEWAPKSSSSVRCVPLSATVEDMLRAYLAGADRLDPQARIWPTNWTSRSVEQQFNRVLYRLHMADRDGKAQKLRVHSLRHTFATRLLRSGADIGILRDLLGHTSISVTDRYLNTPRSELFRAVRRTRDVHDPAADNTIQYDFLQNSRESNDPASVGSRDVATV